MKILLVNKFHYIKGGSETYYFGLGRLLEEMGCEVIFFSMQDEKNEPCGQSQYFVEKRDFNGSMDPGTLLKTSMGLLYSFEAAEKFRHLLRDERPDIVHLNIFQSQLTGSIVDAAYHYKIPVIYTAHDLKSVCPNYQMLNHGEVCERCMKGAYWNCFRTGCMKDSRLKSLLAAMEAYVYKFKRTYAKMDLIIAPSAFYKQKITEAKIANCPVVYRPNFLPEMGSCPEKEEKGEYFLYFGRLSREKGIFTMIKAYARAELTVPLYLAGTGPLEEEIKKLIDMLGVKERVHLLGFKSGDALKCLVQNSLCMCLPSEWYENGPYSVMEAMSMGKPAIVSDMGGLPEMVQDGINGFIFKGKDEAALAEAMIRMAHISCEEYQKLSRNAVEISKRRYNAKEYGKFLVKAYDSVLKKRMQYK